MTGKLKAGESREYTVADDGTILAVTHIDADGKRTALTLDDIADSFGYLNAIGIRAKDKPE